MKENLNKLFDELKLKIDNSNNVLITMSSPDGDSIGSSLALYEVLSKLKSVEIQSSFNIPKYLSFIPEIEKIKIKDVGMINFEKYDLVFLVDSADSFRVIDFEKYGNNWDFPQDTFVVSFDHHGTHNPNFADIDIFDKDSSSTCELVYNFFTYVNYEFSSLTATLLFLGLYTDTGGFYHDNATSNAFKKAGELLEKGADKHFILSNLDTPYSMETMKLLSKAINSFEIIKENNFSYVICTLSKEMLKGFDKDDIENLTNILKGNPGFVKNIVKTDFGIIVTEHSNEVKVSFREKENKYDLSIIAKAMGGGGHSKACAYSSKDNLEDVISKLKIKLKEAFGK